MVPPKVSIILVTYLAVNDKYLRVCLDAIDNLNYPKESLDVVLTSSGEHKPENLPEWVTHNHLPERHHFPEAVNSGVACAAKDSKYYMILNDDTIMTKNSLRNLVEVAGDNSIILGPISNCDNQFKYNLFFGYHTKNGVKEMPRRFYRYDDLKDHFDDLMNAQSAYNRGIISQDYLCFYATLIPKKVWERVGEMDPKFKTGQDDLDYSQRAKDLGVPCAVVLDSLIWHFGGATADLALTDEIRKTNIEYFVQKWGRLPV